MNLRTENNEVERDNLYYEFEYLADLIWIAAVKAEDTDDEQRYMDLIMLGKRIIPIVTAFENWYFPQVFEAAKWQYTLIRDRFVDLSQNGL